MSLRRARRKVREVGALELLRRGVETGVAPRLLAVKIATDTRVRYLSRSELEVRSDAELAAFGTEETISLTAPPEAPSEIERMTGSTTIAPPFVARLPAARLVGDDALAITPDGSFLLETSLGRRDRLEESLLSEPGLLSAALRSPESLGRPADENRRLETVCSLVDGCLGGYSHWLLKALPRLEGVRRWERKMGEQVDLLVPADAPSYVRESLAYFGFGDDRVLEWSGEPATVEGLIVPSVRSPELLRSAYTHRFTYDLTYKLTSLDACEWLRSSALERQLPTGDAEKDESNSSEIEPTPPDRGRRLYISRSDADRRRVHNGEELRAALEADGFECYSLSSLSFSEQVRLFLEADIVVSPHGAGLANLAFANDCAVLELFGSKIKPTYWMLSTSLGLEYDSLECEPVGADVRVDPNVVSERAADLRSA